MNRLDETISNVAYVLDSLRVLRDILDSGSCDDCDVQETCEHKPKLGQLVRYNCPHYLMPDYIKRIRELKKD